MVAACVFMYILKIRMVIQRMKHTLSGYVEPTAEKIAREMGLTLVDVELTKENTGRFLRFFIDAPEGVDLDALERFHRRILPLMEEVDYDYMEVASPGADRPLKKPADFERAQDAEVEVRLYKAVEGAKSFVGALVGLIEGEVVIDMNGREMRFKKQLVAQVAPVVEVDEEAIEQALDGVFDIEDDSASEFKLVEEDKE